MAETLQPLFESIVNNVQAPRVSPANGLQMLCTNIDYDEHKGRIAIGRVVQGTIREKMPVRVCLRGQQAIQGARPKAGQGCPCYKGLDRIFNEHKPARHQPHAAGCHQKKTPARVQHPLRGRAC
jgi:GTP-binding protein